MSFDVRILNFSRIYEEESFYRKDKSSHFIDLYDISGTNCMCDDQAAEEIRRRVFAADSTRNECEGCRGPFYGISLFPL